MLGCYVLAGYVIHYWLSEPRFWTSVRQTMPALFAAGLAATVLAAVPILFSLLFIMDSSRAEIPFQEAARGSLHPASLLTAIVPNLYSVMRKCRLLGAWEHLVARELSLDEREYGRGVYRRTSGSAAAHPCLHGKAPMVAGSPFLQLAVAGLLAYSLGRYTGAFTLVYNYVPGVDLFRRPADATYALGAMAAIASGYSLHLLLSGKEKLAKAQEHMLFLRSWRG